LVKVDQANTADAAANQGGSGGATDAAEADDDDEGVTDVEISLGAEEGEIAGQLFGDQAFVVDRSRCHAFPRSFPSLGGWLHGSALQGIHHHRRHRS